MKITMDTKEEPIAIIGLSCRFPGHASTPSKLWDILQHPRDLSSPLPPSRFNAAGFYHKDSFHHGHSNVKDMRGYYLSEDGAERRFDARFFGINSAEAHVMDPQVRLLLETSYQALESAGQTLDSLRGSDTGCFVGIMGGEYEQAMLKDPEVLGQYHATGTARSLVSNRVSYFYDWHGPSVTIDTACSSSLVALHQAMGVLRSRQSRLALAAGSNMIMDPINFISESKLQMLSPDGQSRMWDADANGYARGEGVAAVVMKRLSDALADGDHIECIIRESGVNSDGRTAGITKPSATAQASLIRDTYRRAGLDVSQPADRPQYFECHGTGTRAGDPIEAEAIYATFFGGSGSDNDSDDEDQLWVGSIKTICGHTESTAGLAGVIKATLAMQRATIPPNMLLNRLNPEIVPFSKHLRVPTTPVPWPRVGERGQPRRASVNSFGFGGTNAHAILESWPGDQHRNEGDADAAAAAVVPLYTPFVFSAASETSLRAYLEIFLEHLQAQDDRAFNARNVAYTLHTRRSRLAYTTAVVARDRVELAGKLRAKLDGGPGAFAVRTAVKTSTSPPPPVLGIFTGQGAAWATMGVELYQKSPAVARILASLQSRLARLPVADRPDWTLAGELGRTPSSSPSDHQYQYAAHIAQPLTTAIQIVLVELLRAAGLTFSAVVGHSSGEIAAAFAAGYISAEDAICIAYYRGLHTRLASKSAPSPASDGAGNPHNGSSDAAGAMLAVGTSAEDAAELLALPKFRGRACLAAVNSASSITISGDVDAIEELQVVFQDEDRFTRRLRVDQAYHSHQMIPCADPHRRALRALDITVNPNPSTGCAWISSCSTSSTHVSADVVSKLACEYWVDNLLKPVYFMHAVHTACTLLPTCRLAIEVGPHPALRSPALETIQDTLGHQEPFYYTGLLKRGGAGDIESVADGLGVASSYLGASSSLDLQAYDQFISEDARVALDKSLPSYCWDHDLEYGHASRHSRSYLFRPRPHELLGSITPDCSADGELRWRQILSPKEIGWLRGHRLQGQIVFPAAGYIVLAIEACRHMVRTRSALNNATLVQISDVDFNQALTFNSDDDMIEVLFLLRNISSSAGGTTTASFECSGAPALAPPHTTGHTSPLRSFATGSVRITSSQDASLVPGDFALNNALPVKSDDFYESLQHLGYSYTGEFNALRGLQRRLGAVQGQIVGPDDADSELLIHPAIIDVAFQAILLARAAPYDGALWSLHLPRTVRRVTVDLSLCESQGTKGKLLRTQACQPTTYSTSFGGDVDVFPECEQISHALVQIEGLHCVPFAPATKQDDKSMLASVHWVPAFPDAAVAASDLTPTPEQKQLSELLDRVSQFYLQNLQRSIAKDDPCRRGGHISGIFAFADHIDSLIRSGTRPFWKEEWFQDNHDTISAAIEPYQHVVDVRLLQRIGDNLVEIAKGNTSAIEVTMGENILNETYTSALGLQDVTVHLARVVTQIAQRYPRLNVLEIGGGTGGTTKAIFSMVDTFASYTFTDVSSGFFPAAKQVFEPHSSIMSYKVLDAGKSPTEQGFSPKSYDMIVASMCLHATPVLRETLRNVRRLLKPGGYLVVQEGFCNDVARSGAIFGAFPDWWLGIDEGRVLGPLVSLQDWDQLLRETGFSGCDTKSTTAYPLSHPTAVFVATAVDDFVDYLRDPLSHSSTSNTDVQVSDAHWLAPAGHLFIVAGENTSHLVTGLERLVKERFTKVTRVETLRTLTEDGLLPTDMSSTTVLSLSELSKPLFKDLDSADFEAAKTVLQSVGSIMWVTEGRRARNPFTNMLVGMVRGAVCEVPTLNSQFFDVETPKDLNPETIAKALLRFKAQVAWTSQHGGNEQNQMLDILEREIVLDQSGREVIPRLIPDCQMNNRYNSQRRAIYHTNPSRPTGDVCLRKDVDHGGYSLQAQLTSLQPASSRHTEQMKLVLSLVAAVWLGAQHQFKFIGIADDECEGRAQIVVLDELCTTISPRSSLGLPNGIQKHQMSQFLHLVALSAVVDGALSNLLPGEVLIAFECGPELATLLRAAAREKCVKVEFMGSKPVTGSGAEELICIDPHAPDRRIDALLSRRRALLLDCGDGLVSNATIARIMTLRATHYRTAAIKDYFSVLPSSSEDAAGSIGACPQLESAVSRARAHFLRDDGLCASPQILPVSRFVELHEKELSEAATSVIDWNDVSHARLKVHPINAQIIFSNNRTYWLAGLSGGLGLSLCEWMIRNGARYMVISSRNPQVDEKWVAKMASLGAVVKVASNDLADFDQTTALYHDICSTMPALGGLAQGAMVLQDTGLRDMTYDAMQKVLRPKVQGSINLEALVGKEALEFFVFFSSATAIIGNAGQSNYSAANMFMVSLAEQRRQRGLAASVMHIGPILGVGYVSQSGDQVRDIFARQGEYTFMSEQDFHQHFAEAVAAGRPDSPIGTPLEVVMGISKVEANPAKDLAWHSNPMAAHMISSATGDAIASKAAKVRASTATLLAKAKTLGECSGILQDAFLPVLSSLFQIDADALDLDRSLDNYGLDSLLAVEIRSWWLKTLQVDVPVLKILDGITAKEIVAFGVERLPRKVIPEVKELSDYQNTNLETPQMDNSEAKDAVAENLKPHVGSKMAPTSPAVTPDESVSQSGHGLQEASDELTISTPASTISSLETPESIPDLRVDGPDDSSNKNACVFPAISRTTELSFNQRLFWFNLVSGEDNGLNHTAAYRISGELSVPDFERAIHTLGERHEILRTRFYTAGPSGQPKQELMQTSRIRLERRQITNEAEISSVAQELQQYSNDVGAGEAMRVVLLTESSTSHVVVTSSHSLVLDGLSSVIFLRQLIQLYDNPMALADEDIQQYFDFTQSQLEGLAAGKFNDGLAFWKRAWSRHPPTLPVLKISSVTSPPFQRNQGNFRADSYIQPQTKSLIWSICRQHKVRPFHFFLTAFRALLARLADVDEIAIGITCANRPETGTMASLGPYVNMVPLRFDNSSKQDFVVALRDTLQQSTIALANSHVPFELLLSELGVKRSSTQAPLFQACFDYRQGMRKRGRIGNCDLEWLTFQASNVPYDICLDIVDEPDNGGCQLHTIVRNDLYTQEEAQTLADYIVSLAVSFARRPDAAFWEGAMFKEELVGKALQFSRGPLLPSYCEPETLVHRIRDIASSTPDKLAVKIAGDTHSGETYLDVVLRSHAVAAHLRAQGCGKGSIVATYQERSAVFLSTILGILSIGAVVLPLDVGSPVARLGAMIQHSRPAVLITSAAASRRADAEMLFETCRAHEVQIVSTESIDTAKTPQLEPSTSIQIGGEDAAMILYTSGSTGTPKGIVLKHAGFRSWVESVQNMLGTGSEEVFLQQATCAFDMCFVQIFLTLWSGSTLCIVPTSARADAIALSEMIAAERITMTSATPSEYTSWLSYGNRVALTQSLQHWRVAFTGGEPTSSTLIDLWRSLGNSGSSARGPRFFNIYGPTEITFGCTGDEVKYAAVGRQALKFPIDAGKPLPNYLVYILDDHLQPVPPGHQGEIFIGGVGVAREYANDPGLTAEKFIPSNLVPSDYAAKAWSTLHRSGDLGRWRENGSLLIEGRKSTDTQVKLRGGLRVDLAEIENVMLKEAREMLSQVVVSVHHPSAFPETAEILVAHVVLDTRNGVPSPAQQAFVRALPSCLPLPQYMRPAAVNFLEKLPVMISGKLDRKAVAALPLPEGFSSPSQASVELSETEARMEELWAASIARDITKQHRISKDTDFFQIGGTSLLLLSLQRRIQTEFATAIPLVRMFENSTLAAMSQLVHDSTLVQPNAIDRVDWEAECEIPSTVLDSLPAATEVGIRPPRCVVLTGATGFLGQAYLQALLADPTVSTVHCLAVRRPNLLPSHPKIVPHKGDLGLPRLGLDAGSVTDIFNSADVILHNGADTSHLKSFDTLRSVNLQATKELAAMCLDSTVLRKIPFHYISTAGVWSCSDLEEADETSAAACSPSSKWFVDGYTASKWASEMFLEKLHKTSNASWPIWIHRPSSIQPDNNLKPEPTVQTGDLMGTLLAHYCKALRAVPSMPNVRGMLNQVSVHQVVESTMGQLQAKAADTNTSRGPHYIHAIGDVNIDLTKLKDYVQSLVQQEGTVGGSEGADTVIEVSQEEWLEKATALGMDAAMVAFLSHANTRAVNFPRLVKGA